MNDSGCDPDRRLYCGTMAYDARRGAAALYRLDADGEARVVLDGVTIPNGLDWTPDGTRACDVDTPTQRIGVLDCDRDAGLTRRRPFVALPPEAGRSDGLRVDAEGGVGVALYRGAPCGATRATARSTPSWRSTRGT